MSTNIGILSRDNEATVDFGSIFLGLIVNCILWGIQIAQSYYYYRSYSTTDRIWLKATVCLLIVADAFQSLCIAEGTWHMAVYGWGDMIKAKTLGWGIIMTPFIHSFTASIVHFFYAHKIWVIVDKPYNYIWTVIILALSSTQLAAGTGGSIESFGKTLSTLLYIKPFNMIWLITAVATDILITALMTWKLSSVRTGYGETDEILAKLVRMIVETGLATSVCQITHAVITFAWPTKLYVMFPGSVTPKLYSNSMLALLNSRQPRSIKPAWEVSSKVIEKIRFGPLQSGSAMLVYPPNTYHSLMHIRSR